MRATPQVKCPTCRKAGDWFAGKHGPFCSHRCQLIDLGKWFAEEHAVSSPLRPEPGEELHAPPAGPSPAAPDTEISD